MSINLPLFLICNATYRDIQHTTLLTQLALLTTQYYIRFSFPFAHTEPEGKREKKKKKKRKGKKQLTKLHLYFSYFKILHNYSNKIKVTKMLVFVDLLSFEH